MKNNQTSTLTNLAVSTAITGAVLSALNVMGDKMLGNVFGLERTSEEKIIKELSNQVFQLASLNSDLIEYYETNLRRERTKSEEMKIEISNLKKEVEMKKNANANKKKIEETANTKRKPGRRKKK